ncbi:hypothetical protein D0N87_27890, partial [Pseudomonas sp. ATCC 13867]
MPRPAPPTTLPRPPTTTAKHPPNHKPDSAARRAQQWPNPVRLRRKAPKAAPRPSTCSTTSSP